MILILERNEQIRNEIVNAVQWVDRRHQVIPCSDVYSGLSKAARFKPRIVLTGPSITADIAIQFRSNIPGALIVGLGVKDGDDNSSFDVKLPAVEHHKIREVLESARQPRPGARTEDKRRTRQRRREDAITITVCDGTLRFSMSAAAGSSLGSFLAKLSEKNAIVSYALLRKGVELSTTLETPLEHGDELGVKLSSSGFHSSTE